jgi:hypothetical protein
MEVVCPYCVKKVALGDDRAGQAVSCPLCAQSFMAPLLMHAAPPIPAPVPEIPAEAPPQVKAEPPPPLPPPMKAEPPPPAPKPAIAKPAGEYTKQFVVRLRSDYLVWLTPLAMLLVVFLSFLPWHKSESMSAASLWNLSFGEASTAPFLFYLIFTVFLGTPAALAFVVVDRRWLALPQAFQPYWPWASLALGLLLAVSFLLLGIEYLHAQLYLHTNPITVPMKLAFRLHGLAMLAALGEFWLQRRRLRNLPPPRLDLRW